MAATVVATARERMGAGGSEFCWSWFRYFLPERALKIVIGSFVCALLVVVVVCKYSTSWSGASRW